MAGKTEAMKLEITKGKCANRGADNSLHHYDTLQCPKNGVEEMRDGHSQEWAETAFYDAVNQAIERDAISTYQKCGILPSELFALWRESVQNEAKATIQRDQFLEVLNVIMAEINSTPMAVQYFDLRIIKAANEAIKNCKQ